MAVATRADTPAPVHLSDEGARRLRLGNLLIGLLHAGQAAVLLALSTGFTLPVVETFQDGPPGSAPPAPETLFELPLGPAVAAFLILAAVDHLLCATPGVYTWYTSKLRQGINPVRWLEYSLSASLMIALIAMLIGVTSLVALIGIVGANAAMILFGWRMESVNDHTNGPVDWRPFLFGSLVGLVPWVAVVAAIVGAEAETGAVPTFVYAIVISLFLLFNTFAVNQGLQYGRVGRFRDYVFGEWGYLVLSLVAKSALAWQVFGNVLAA